MFSFFMNTDKIAPKHWQVFVGHTDIRERRYPYSEALRDARKVVRDYIMTADLHDVDTISFVITDNSVCAHNGMADHRAYEFTYVLTKEYIMHFRRNMLMSDELHLDSWKRLQC